MKKRILFSLLISTVSVLSCKKPDTSKPSGPKPVTSFTDTLNGYTASFTSTSTGYPTAFAWNFGDGSKIDSSNKVIHTFTSSGTFHVVLTAKNSQGSDTIGRTITIKRQLALFNYSTDGYNATFKSISPENPTSLSWNFGDGSKTGTTASITHPYATSGTYHVVLTASNSSGVDTFGMNVTVYEQVVDIRTRFGDMYLWLYNEMPIYKANYLKNVTTHLYDSTTFHRCVPNFVIQGGDSLSKGADQSQTGTGGGDHLPFKVVTGITHIYGAVGAASLGAGQPGNDWQFYIVTNKSGDHQLDGSYAVFGYIMSGMNTALTIQSQPQNTANNMPNTPIRMSCTILNETKAQILSNYGYTVK